jgi:hypothetical protein
MTKSALVLALLATAVLAFGQEQPTPPAGGPAAAGPGAAARTPEPVIKPYDKVITKEAKTKKGLFWVHQIKDKLYYEIPKAAFGKDYLLVSTLTKTTLGAGYGGTPIGSLVVRWERHERRVLLRGVSFEVTADEKSPISRAVRNSNNDTILMAFNIEALNKEDAPVIEVTRLFTTEVTELSARRVLGARGFDASRSFIERVAAFPENVNIEVTQTYTIPPETPGMTAMPRTPPMSGRMRANSGTVVVSHSMVKLPEKPMMPRLYDDRIGYFNIRQTDFASPEHRADQKRYIVRWRLEKKDPSGAISEPVKPIVFYVDPATPTQWVLYVIKGVEAWRAAFEEAGFRNAIVCKTAPSATEDPDWSPEDARYSVIRWLPSAIKNAMGPNVHDPRTGEILEADIQIFHNVLELQRDWYFTQAGPLDARARKLPLPDDLMGELLCYVITHEVGHSLGFQHNFKASALYPIEKLRDREWLKKMGHIPTLMDYSRFNYVAQPEDKIEPELLIPRLGPYDKYATMWGYKPIPGAASPEAEKATLDDWLKPQQTTPWLRFSTPRAMGADPGDQTEAVGDADPVQATTLGTKNVQRVMDMLLTAVPRKGENYDDLAALYAATLGQWHRELLHVVPLVGGFHSQNKHAGEDGVLFTPVPKEKQQAAVKYLNAAVFATPKWAVRPEILRRVEPVGGLSRILTLQRSVLSGLLNPSRITRLQEQEAIDGEKSYKSTELLADVRAGLFGELGAAAPRVDSYRRNLQRAYIELINERLNGRPVSIAVPASMASMVTPAIANDDTRALLRGELRALDALIAGKAAAAGDRITGLHLREMRDTIARILDPRFAPQTSSAMGAMIRTGAGEEENDTCWPNLALPFLPRE